VNASGLVTAGTSTGVATITVTATAGGGATNFAATTRSQLVTINVVTAPQAITSLTATPSSLSLATQGQGQIAATITQPAGAPAATITFGSTNPAVATFTAGPNNTATITGVSAGTATITVTASAPAATGFAASTLTQLIPVTVAPAAQVSIGDIRRQTDDLAVDINNVFDQIQVALNITTNGQNVSSAQVWVCEPSDDVPTCAARTNGVPAAQQSFGSAGANDGIINTFINTAEFTVDADFANATVRHTNGQKVLVATLTVAGQAAVASNNRAILNFNNTDGFASRHVAPVRNAINASTNVTFFGGPGADGRGSITIVPVIYTAGRSIQRATANVDGVCQAGTGITFVTGTDARPWTYTYGYSLGTTTGANAKNIVCSAQSSNVATPSTNADLHPIVTSSIDNAQNSGPTVSTVGGFRTSSSNSPAVVAPARIRVDYAAPSVAYDLTAQNGGVVGWANGAYNFAASGMRTVSDATNSGVGVNTSSFSYAFRGCGVTTFTAFTTNSGADINECATDFTQGAYFARLTAQDLLTNEASDETASFGVDKTAPLVQFAVAVPDDSTVRTTAFGAGTILQAETLDERSGLDDATAARHFLSTANQANPNGLCIVPTASTTNVPGANFVTAAACPFSQTGAVNAGPLGVASTSTGYKPFTAIDGATIDGIGEGYYTYAAAARDRAGNESTPVRRRFLLSVSTPLISGIGLPGGQLNSTGNSAFTPNFAETVEAWFTNFRVSYAGLPVPTGTLAAPAGGARLLFPATLYNARFNNVIGLNGNTTVGTPFTSGTQFYTDFEFVDAGGAPVATGNTLRTDSIGARVYNVGGFFTPVQMAGVLNPNVATDALRWRAASPTTTNSKAPLLTQWTLGTSNAAWNAPAGGLKAIALSGSAGTAQNSPFDRVDFYEFVAGETWNYLGSVSGTQTPAPANSPNGSLYLADNGGTRVWTYRLTQAALDSASITGTAPSLSNVAGRFFVAIGSRGTAGRVLATNPLSPAADYPAATAVAGLNSFSVTPSTLAQTLSLSGTTSFNFTGDAVFNAPGAASVVNYNCFSDNTNVATVSCGAVASGDLTSSTVTAVGVGTANITVVVSTPNGIGFSFSTSTVTYTVTVNP
jgi:hypothetical protein